MTTQHVPHAMQGKDARKGLRFVFSPRHGSRTFEGAPQAFHTFQLFKPGALRVNKRGVTIAPVGVAGLVLACVSVTACRHAASEPINDGLRDAHEAATVVVPVSGDAKRNVVSSRTTNAKVLGSAAPTSRHNTRTGDTTHTNVSLDMPATASSLPVVSDDAPASSASSQVPGETAATPLYATAASEKPFVHDDDAPVKSPSLAIQTASAAASPKATWKPWATWGAPSVATVALTAGLVAVSRRRRTRKAAARNSATVIGWKGWRYVASKSSARSEFFGAEHPKLPEAWSIDRVNIDNWGEPDTGAIRIRPATDARYGLLKPVRPPMVDLSLDDDAFLLWIATTGVSEPIHGVGDVRDESVTDAAPAAAMDVAEEASPFRMNTEATAQAADYDISSPSIDGAAMVHAEVPMQAAFPQDMAGEESAASAALEAAAMRQAEIAAAEQIRQARLEREALEREALRLEAMQREAREREAEEREALRQEALRLEAVRLENIQREKEREAERLEAVRIENERAALARREAERREAAEAEARRTEAMRNDAVNEARKQLTAGYPSKALDILAPALAGPHTSGEAWTVAGWCWWRIARDNGPDAVKAVSEAIKAFHQAMAAEPDRAAMLGSALTRCHLFMADHLQGQARADSIDAALRLMGSDTSPRRDGDSKFAIERASALFDRAELSSGDERAQRMELAQRALSDVPAKDMDDSARWLQVSIWMAQAEASQGRTADALLGRAVDALTHALHAATDDARDNWLARLIDVELLRLRHLKAAARVMRLRQLRDAYQPLLAQARSILPLLSWVQVLREWAGMLSEHPAREKLAEAETLFERIESMSPDDLGSVHFARAYYLRLRSAHESVGNALDTLAKANALLAPITSPALPAETILLERAEVALARARLLGERERLMALDEAIRFSDASVRAEDGNLPRALACGITARLAKLEKQVPSDADKAGLIKLARRLADVSPHDAEALRLSARCEFTAGEPAAASRLCEAAWDAGCRDAELLRLWRESMSRHPGALANVENDPQWKRLNQCMRLAQSTGMATR